MSAWLFLRAGGAASGRPRIAELEARVAELERFRRETAYLRNEARTERDLRLLTGESRIRASGCCERQQPDERRAFPSS